MMKELFFKLMDVIVRGYECVYDFDGVFDSFYLLKNHKAILVFMLYQNNKKLAISKGFELEEDIQKFFPITDIAEINDYLIEWFFENKDKYWEIKK